MSNKETLQSYNEELTKNGITIEEILQTVNSLPVYKETRLQDKTIEITENGTTTIAADESYDGLNNVSVTTNVAGSVNASYIKDCRYLFNKDYRQNEVETVLPLCTKATTFESMFQASKVAAVTGFANFKSENTVSVYNMFAACTLLKSIDFGPNTQISTNNVSSMFSSCQKLTSVDLSGFTLSGVTSLASMFVSCFALTKLDLTPLDLSNVTSGYQTFANCYVLEELDISNWNLSNITSYSNMFFNCGKNLTSPTIVYVRDQTAQDWVLNTSNGRPDTWTTANVIIK